MGQLKYLLNIPDKDGQIQIPTINIPHKDEPIEKIEQFELAMKIECFFYEKIMLYLFKQTHPEYEHKELIFLPPPKWEIDNVETNMLEDNIPDALLYDTVDETYTTLYYKYTWETNFEHFENPDFCLKYNNTIHLMIIISAKQEDFQTIYDIIKQHRCQFDVRIQTQYDNVQEYADLAVDKETLKKINELDIEFMAEEGEQVRQLFYREYYYRYYYKFKYDQKFINEFYEFAKEYTAEKNKWKWVPAVKF